MKWCQGYTLRPVAPIGPISFLHRLRLSPSKQRFFCTSALGMRSNMGEPHFCSTFSISCLTRYRNLMTNLRHMNTTYKNMYTYTYEYMCVCLYRYAYFLYVHVLHSCWCTHSFLSRARKPQAQGPRARRRADLHTSAEALPWGDVKKRPQQYLLRDA